MTDLQRIKMLIKGTVTANGVLGADRLKVWQAKHFAKIGKPHGATVGVKFSVAMPSKMFAKVQVEIRWKGSLKDTFRWSKRLTPEDIIHDVIEMNGSPSTADLQYLYVLGKAYRALLKKEFKVSIGSKKFTGVRGEQVTAVIDAVLFPDSAEIVKL